MNSLPNVSGSGTEIWRELEEWIFDESSYADLDGDVEGFEAVPDHILEELLTIASQTWFTASTSESHNLIRFFGGEWQRFTGDQRMRIVRALADLYPIIRDPLALFVICEILGEISGTEAALDLLDGLTERVTGHAKAMLATGYVAAAKHPKSPVLRQRALLALNRLAADEDEIVRHEAASELQYFGPNSG